MAVDAVQQGRAATLINNPGGGVLITGGTFNNISGPPADPLRKIIQKAFGQYVAPYATHDSNDRVDPPRCHPKTRRAILKRLRTWVQHPAHSSLILWLSGPAGAGKSAIAGSLAEMLAKNELLAATFFFMIADKRNHEQLLVSTIAYQIALSTPEIQPFIVDAIDEDHLVFQQSLETQFRKLVVEPIAKLSMVDSGWRRRPRLIIIDGLDECRSSDVQCHILKIISDALPYLDGRFKFLIVSRPEYHIETTFSQPHLQPKTLSITLTDDPDSSKDVRLFLTERFDEIKRSHPLRSTIDSSWPSEEKIQRLVQKSSGNFVYPHTAMKYIGATHDRPEKRLDVVLGVPLTTDSPVIPFAASPFAELDDLYRHILESVRADRTALSQILGVLMACKTRMSLPAPTQIYDRDVYTAPEFVEKALMMSPGKVRLTLIDLRSLISLERSDYTSYATVRFLHSSFPDFLLDCERSGEFAVDIGQACMDIARGCLQVLARGEFGAGRCKCAFSFTCEHSRDTEMAYRVGFFWSAYNMDAPSGDDHNASLLLQSALLGFDATYVFSTLPGDVHYKEWIFHWDWIGPFLECLDSAKAFEGSSVLSHHVDKFRAFFEAQLLKYSHAVHDRRFIDASTLLMCIECVEKNQGRGRIARMNAEIWKCIRGAVRGVLRLSVADDAVEDGKLDSETQEGEAEGQRMEDALERQEESEKVGSSSGKEMGNPWTIMRQAVRQVVQMFDAEAESVAQDVVVGGGPVNGPGEGEKVLIDSDSMRRG